MHYTQRYSALLNLARALIKAGWTCHTYEPRRGVWPNESRESWLYGVAEKSDFILVVDESQGRKISGFEYKGNPSGKLWHIQRKDGTIIRSGRTLGWWKLYDDKCETMINHWDAIISGQPWQQTKASTADSPPEGVRNYSHGGPVEGVDGPVTWEIWVNSRGNVEVRFSDRPTPEVRSASVKSVKLRWHKVTGLWWGSNEWYASSQTRWAILSNILTRLSENYAKEHGEPEPEPQIESNVVVAPKPKPGFKGDVIMRDITFEDSESDWFTVRPWKFSRWYDAEAFLEWLSETAPKGGAYHKTWFLVRFNNGVTYEGRYDVQRPGLETMKSLKEQMECFITYNAGVKCPPHEWLREDSEEEAIARWVQLLDNRHGKEHRPHWAQLYETLNLNPSTYDDHFESVVVAGLPFIYESGTNTWYYAHESGNYTYEIARPVIAYEVSESPGWTVTLKGTVFDDGELLASGRRQRGWNVEQVEDRQIPFYTMYEVAREINWVDNIVVPRASEKRTVEIIQKENEPMKRVVTTDTPQGEVVTVSDAATGTLLVQAPKKVVKQFALW